MQYQPAMLGTQRTAGVSTVGQGPSWASLSSECSSNGSGMYSAPTLAAAPLNVVSRGPQPQLPRVGTIVSPVSSFGNGVLSATQPVAASISSPVSSLGTGILTAAQPAPVAVRGSGTRLVAAATSSVGTPMPAAEYNAQLDAQLDGGLLKEPPEKNTFIHYKIDSSLVIPSPEWVSAPDMMITKPFTTNHPSMEERHLRGNCKPCAYFLYKADGCRHGDQCEYCHLCKRGEIKKRKKEKVKQLRADEAAEKAAAEGSGDK